MGARKAKVMADALALIDYGAGNLHSVHNALKAAGAERIAVTSDPNIVRGARRIVLPGVGSFKACMDGLSAIPGLIGALEKRVLADGVPFLGVCVGMQLMAARGLEFGETEGLGWIDGQALGVLTTEYSRRVQLNTEDLKTVLSRNLSGGNQQKVVLAKWLMRGPKLFILDEPTRGVDVGAKAEIYKIINSLVADGCGVLLISSELEELTGMCDRILVMNNGEITGSFERGGFDPEAMLEAAMRQGTRASA